MKGHTELCAACNEREPIASAQIRLYRRGSKNTRAQAISGTIGLCLPCMEKNQRGVLSNLNEQLTAVYIRLFNGELFPEAKAKATHA